MTPEQEQEYLLLLDKTITKHFNKGNTFGYTLDGIYYADDPKYSNDLNLMHKAELTLSDKQYNIYGKLIADHTEMVAKGNSVDKDDESWYLAAGKMMLSATAKLRAEMFIKVIEERY